jgi:hypothetical protein
MTIFEDHLVRDINAGRFADNASLVLVTHGLALRIFLMRCARLALLACVGGGGGREGFGGGGGGGGEGGLCVCVCVCVCVFWGGGGARVVPRLSPRAELGEGGHTCAAVQGQAARRVPRPRSL